MSLCDSPIVATLVVMRLSFTSHGTAALSRLYMKSLITARSSNSKWILNNEQRKQFNVDPRNKRLTYDGLRALTLNRALSYKVVERNKQTNNYKKRISTFGTKASVVNNYSACGSLHSVRYQSTRFNKRSQTLFPIFHKISGNNSARERVGRNIKKCKEKWKGGRKKWSG